MVMALLRAGAAPPCQRIPDGVGLHRLLSAVNPVIETGGHPGAVAHVRR